jgi:ascorbate-specific PTS system EIIC-type component UlaA
MAYNGIYVIYPFTILAALAFTKNDLHDNAVLALIFTAFPLGIELFQIVTDFKEYFLTGANIFDFSGLVCIIVFFVAGHSLSYHVNLPLLLFGLFCIFYRGIMSLSCIYDKFMINLKLMKNSIMGMIPFLAVLFTQILLFTSLNAVK